MKRVTIRDVSERAGVSTAAVSYVLNGREGKVSPDTIKKVQQAIKELNYIPDFSARSLANNKSKLIGVVIPQTEDQSQLLLQNPFYSEFVCGIEAKLRQAGYHMILSGVDKGDGYLDTSMQRNLDGAIILGIYQESFYEELKKVELPIVLIDSYIHDRSFNVIGIDDEEGGYLATRHLIENGHTGIALVTGMIRKDGVIEKRFLGYKRALKEAGLFYNADHVFESSVTFEYGEEAGGLIARQFPDITAVFATSDMVALGVMRGLNEAGRSVPGDVSVIGFDDLSIARMSNPPLTTVNQRIAERGSMAAQCLLEAIDGTAEASPAPILTPLSLVVRGTVRSLR
ncbi:LacI family DNA-binding transcriptional regulator [Cohnella nanjingensis]|uniref:LacI family DNA-binding transcriptional regulator n=1 Tax=Cohnella nanjingensis TaxID=1387779 RepID=A0A7X0VGV8_9BACL|nr:LacI family DNA-binding transcriptional regulator [Cohnella nanjingensis]MBB6673510.1 LacI family DNA-binding transcriptional regulator [Cohnella nanjingensis]